MTWEAALLFVRVIGSIYLGLATPNEAAALGAFVVMIMVLLKPQRFTIIWNGPQQSGSVTCAVFGLIIGAGLFSMALTTSRLPVEVAQWAGSFDLPRSEEHTSELQSLMRSSYAVVCLKKHKKKNSP